MKIHWTSCADCEFGAVERVPRKLWMRLLPSMRYYHCTQCESFVLARKDVVEAKKWRCCLDLLNGTGDRPASIDTSSDERA